MARLKIAQAREDDVYGDIVRVNRKYRVNRHGKAIPSGAVCRVRTGLRSIRALTRGLPYDEGAVIRMDEPLRQSLEVQLGQEYDVKFERCGLIGELIWGFWATDPSYRISSRLALLSVILAEIGLILGIIAFFRS